MRDSGIYSLASVTLTISFYCIEVFSCFNINTTLKMKKLSLTILAYLAAYALSAQCAALFTWDDTDISIQFMDASTIDPGDVIISWMWDFDDNGNTSTQQNPSYTFSEPDKYDVQLSITTQNGCSSSITVEIETCVLAVSYTIGSCDVNGSIPVLITINDIYDNADEIDIILDGSSVPGSPFQIDQENPVMASVFVPGNGLSHTIQIQSTDIATCGKNIEFTVPDCNSNCFLSSLQIGYPQGLTHTVNVGDDFFNPVSTGIVLGDVVHFNWIGDGHSTTSDATSGADAWNSGVISVGSNFDVTIQNPGTHPYYCIPHGGTGGAGMSGEILANCPTGTNLDIEINFNTTVANTLGYNVYYDAVLVSGSPFSYDGVGTQLVTTSIAGDGNSHALLIEDVNDPTCTLSSSYNAPDCGQGGGNPVCGISLSSGAPSGCDASQNVSVDALISVSNGGSGFNLSIDNGTPTYYSYNGPNTTVSLTLPGDGQIHNIVVTDDLELTCNANTNLTTPNCNLPCSISNLSATAGGGNGGAGIVHSVNVQDFIFNPSVINITTGDQVEWQWTGNVAHTATSDANSGPDSFDSGLLSNGDIYLSPVLSEGSHPYYCTPHGEPGGVGMAGTIFVLPPCNAQGEVMVTVTFDITSNGINGFEILVDGSSAGIFPYDGGAAQSATVNVTGDNISHTIEVRDVDEPTCLSSTTVVTSDCNGGGNPVCMIDVTAAVNGGCDANNEVPVQLTVTASDQSSNFVVLVDGINQGTFAYTGSSTIISVNIPGDGQNHTVSVTDEIDLACTSTANIITTDCSLPCSIINLSASAGGGGAGGMIHFVNVEDYIFNPSIVNITIGDQVEWQWTGNVAHTATSDANSGPDSFDSGLLSNGDSYLSPVLSEGSHPYYCTPHGEPGGVGMAGTIFVLPPCNAQGEVIVTVTFDITSNGINGYEVLVDGSSAGIFPYVGGGAQSASVNVAGDNISHTIEVRDVDELTCLASTTIVTSDCNGGGNPVCMIDVTAAVNGGCDANNEVPVQLTVTASDQSSNFVVLVDGINQGTFAYTGSSTIITLNVTGDGQTHTISVTDENDPACNKIVSLVTPDCQSGCTIVEVNLSFGLNTTHIIQVEDFKFIPDSINIVLGDTILFDWTGIIPHTATSDANNGPNSFDSGLLSQGGLFEFTPTSIGEVPYYCVPHGLPGGNGMAGNITVNAACEGENANANISVSSEGSSGQGFSLTLDGNIIPESPLAFDPSGNSEGSITVPGDNMTHVLVIADLSNLFCIDSISFQSPQCSIDSCQASISNVSFSECDGALVLLTIDFNSLIGAEAYNIYMNGILLSVEPVITDTLGFGTFSTNISGLGSEIEIEVSNLLLPSCADTTLIVSPDCNTACIIENAIVGKGVPVYEIEVKDFEFFPENIEVLIGDTIRFLWTDLILHTTTSDTQTGDDSWDSGLLGQGAVYDLVINNEGIHPYYCSPHGGPNGIGMSGSINVIDTCDGENWLTKYSFSVSAGSPLGYNIFVDGELWNTNPIMYTDPLGSNTGTLSLPGDGATHFITFQDLETDFCAFTTTVTTGECGANCTIELLTVQTGSEVIHEIEVRDFDFLPLETTVSAGETVRFIWTGAIPHSTTSDVFIGPDMWDSGLLSEGDTFDIVLNTPGDHKYFCTPHGGPNGIGQSGVIHVLPQCQDGEQATSISFAAHGGSDQGYNLFVDGIIISSGNPYENANGNNEFSVLLPADGLQHIVTVQDDQNSICAASAIYSSGNCATDCELAGLSYELISNSHTVLVRDFDYLPIDLIVEAGDTVVFDWVGDVAHTVTSDAIDGPSVFNSGLLQKDDQWLLILSEIKNHPYFCIPHGGPNGSGMAGSVEVIDACDDGELFARFTFISSKLTGTYKVLQNGIVVIAEKSYSGIPQNSFNIPIPADNSVVEITVVDNQNSDCLVTLSIDGINCNDPCFGTNADYTYNIDFTTLNVAFTSTSTGNIESQMWDFGDSNFSDEKNPNHVFSDPVVYEVCLTVIDSSDCEDTFCDKVRFSDEVCIAAFEYIQNDLDFTFINTSDYEDADTEILWTFGDGAISTDVDTANHSFELGLYTVCIQISSDSCSSSYCIEIDLTDPCLLITPEFNADKDGGSLTVEFLDLSSGSPDSWLWGFGDGNTSTVQNPIHPYSSLGEYNVCLFVQESVGSCSKSICRKISVGTTGVNEIELYRSLTIYPNPSIANSAFYVEGFTLEDLGKMAKITILNNQGKIIRNYQDLLDERVILDVEASPGVYIINITSDQHVYQSLFVKY